MLAAHRWFQLQGGRRACLSGAASQCHKKQQQQHRCIRSTSSSSSLAAIANNFAFCGDLRYATHASQAKRWLGELLQLADSSSCDSGGSGGSQESPVVVGFDSEVPVVWQGSSSTSLPNALLQLCYHPPGSEQPICLLLQLSKIGVTPQMQEVLAHPGIAKVGMGIATDMRDVLRDYNVPAAVRVQSAVDLNQLACACGVEQPLSPAALARRARLQQEGRQISLRKGSWGLAGLVQALTGHVLPKPRRVTASNWSKVPLSERQMHYAAADAYAGVVIYYALKLFWLQQQQQQGSSSLMEPGVAGQLQQLHAAAAAVSTQVSWPAEQRQPLFADASGLSVLTSSSAWQLYEPAVTHQQQWTHKMLVSYKACLSRLSQLQSRAC